MTIIGDAVAGANFERSEPLAAHRHGSRQALPTSKEQSHEDPDRQPPDRRRGRLVRQPMAPGPRRSRNAEVANDKEAEARLEAIGKAAYANNEVVDVNLIDIDLVDGAIVPPRLRERIRAAGPTNRTDLGKQARRSPRRPDATAERADAPRETKMYRYDEFDHDFVKARVAEFSDQVERRLAGEITEDQFKPLRLMNGVYLQLHAYMLRVAIPYGTLNSKQMRMLGHIARKYDKGYGHFTTRQNIQYNWPALSDMPAILADLASVEMHAIQTSGNCIRNVTADHFAGAAADEVADPRPYAEILRQWSSVHPEFSYLPRKFKIAVTGAERDRAAIQVHDIGLHLKKNDKGELGFAVYVGGGQGRTPMIAKKIRDFLPEEDLLSYMHGDHARLQSATAAATTSTRRASRSSCTRPARRNSPARSRPSSRR